MKIDHFEDVAQPYVEPEIPNRLESTLALTSGRPSAALGKHG
jgi:hypothetical protein